MLRWHVGVFKVADGSCRSLTALFVGGVLLHHTIIADDYGRIGLDPGADERPALKSWPADPFMSAEQESRILKTLAGPPPFRLRPGMTLDELAEALSDYIPSKVDRRGIEEFGLTGDMEVVPGPDRAQKPPPKPKSNHDPFSGAPPLSATPPKSESHAPAARSADGLTALSDDLYGRAVPNQAQDKRNSGGWWRTTADAEHSTEPSLGAELIGLLYEFDLTPIVAKNRLTITTIEASAEHLPVRVYDITPLSLAGRPGMPMSDSTDSIMRTIQSSIDPDIWEALGGPAAMNPLHVRGRQWLVIAAPSVVHWKTTALLERLVENSPLR